MKKVKEYYKQLQYNVVQTAIDNLPSKDRLVAQDFVSQMNLTSELISELNVLGYEITKIPKKKIK